MGGVEMSEGDLIVLVFGGGALFGVIVGRLIGKF
jgi:hypothetical protein